jgi:hypothetical protein
MTVEARNTGEASLSAIEDHWQREATNAAIEAARNMLGMDRAIPAGTPIGRLGETEWGWIVAAVLFGWIKTRAEQAAAMEIDTEQAIRMTGLDRNPWDAGAIAAILPELAEVPGVDWSKPLGEWPKEAMVDFLLEALRLVRKGMIARDLGGGITRRSSADVIASAPQAASAATDGPFMTPDELNDPVPF